LYIHHFATAIRFVLRRARAPLDTLAREMTRVNLLVRALDGRTRCLDVDLDLSSPRASPIARVHDAIFRADAALLPPGARARFLTSAAARASTSASAPTDVRVEITASLLGGKGGFGTQLRTAARRGQQTTNFDACRDLDGRRLRAVNGEKKIAEWEANKEEREREKQAEEYLKKQAKANGAARLREVEEKEREAYHAESAKVSEGVEAAVANGLKEAAAIEAAKRKGKEIVVEEESDEDDDDDDFDDSALLFPAPAKKKMKMAVDERRADVPGTSTVAGTSQSHSPTSAVPERAKEKALDLSEYDSAEALEALGMERLKQELADRQLKCGGALSERAARLFLLRDNTRDEIDKKHWAKPGPK
tara:strand:- start:1516 stop:2604 length:1089 start_codon:yes stop_codon:yes gene_type:complete